MRVVSPGPERGCRLPRQDLSGFLPCSPFVDGVTGKRPRPGATILHTQHTQSGVASKNISIPDDVYRRLAEEKREGESFGDVIDRLMKGRPLSEFSGAWSEETAELTRETIREGRQRSDDRLGRLYGDG